MRAIRVHENGDPEVLRAEDVPSPTAGPGELLVDIEAVGVNFIEIYQRMGLYQVPRPYTPGAEAAGVVRQLGEGVTDFAVGDLFEVEISLGDGAIQYVAFDQDGTDGSQNPAAIALYPVTTGSGETASIAGIVRHAEVNGNLLVWPDDIEAGEKANAIDALAKLGIIVR